MRTVCCLSALVLTHSTACIVEGDELDDERDDLQAEVTGPPDFQVWGAWFYDGGTWQGYYPRVCNVGGTIYLPPPGIQLTVKNLVSGVTSNAGSISYVTFYTGTCRDLSALVCGGLVSCTLPIGYELKIDAANAYAEPSEVNNTGRIGPDFLSQYLYRDASSYRFRFCNIGKFPMYPEAGDFMKVKFTNKTLGITHSQPSGVMAPNQCLEASVPCSAIGDPTCGAAITVKAKADSAGNIHEPNETNNAIRVKFAAGEQYGTVEPDLDPTD